MLVFCIWRYFELVVYSQLSQEFRHGQNNGYCKALQLRAVLGFIPGCDIVLSFIHSCCVYDDVHGILGVNVIKSIINLYLCQFASSAFPFLLDR